MFSKMKCMNATRVDLDKTDGEKAAHRACAAVGAAQARLGFVHAYSSELLPLSCASVNAWVAGDRNHMQLVISSVKELLRALWVWRPPSSVLMSPRSQDILALLFSALMPPIP